ncbi:nucleotide sugar dehydrogenase [Terasakiella sp. A23]|uniref:nucleotide sugar dehydrogenase n=1 Tax=Terasakiella sp. FCG-A23 TaxID=3080561 RepID=UPI002952BD40|nr:nucleotide sugar dehydrogenase [Terasakiella sp. A23]MDV7339797.1 nucleotide sugar dehydrogenase [Terasakiella sp. A23]
MTERKIAVIGLGYVGLPVAVSYGRQGYPCVGFDIDQGRIKELQGGYDRTEEVEDGDVLHDSLTYSSDLNDLKQSNFYIVTVPTPIDSAHRPDMGAVLAASRTVAQVLKKGDIVVYESTVYPGATEEDCVPVLEELSGLKCGEDFSVGYSPERINPGDKEHRFETILKVVSGYDAATLDIVARTYEAVVTAGVHRAPNIKTAEAAKVIENTQRDLNIAFVNELSQIFERVGIDTHDVLEAAGTKWNFLKFTPGLVGGHCIGVDPYYLTHKAEQLGHHPQVILAGRRVNDRMGHHIAMQVAKMLMKRGRTDEPRVTILGLTFKENVPDLRNSKVVDIISELEEMGVTTQITDPWANKEEAMSEYGVKLQDETDLKPADVIVFAVPHKKYIDQGWALVENLLKDKTGFVVDIKSVLDRNNTPSDITLWRL